MNKATFSKTLSGLRELELDVANLAEEGQIQIQGDFPTTEQVLIADPTINGNIYKTLTPSMIGLENLTAGTNITYSAGTTYNGTAPITINATDTNTQLTLVEQNGIVITDLGGLNRGIATDIDNDTIVFNGTEMEVAKVPNSLTAGTNITFNIGTTYDGSQAITISSIDNDTQLNLTGALPMVINNGGGLNREVELQYDNTTLGAGGGALTVSKVPNVLTKGTNINFINTDDGAIETTYDGSTPITISSTDTDTTYQGGKNITIDTTTNPDTINLDDDLTGIDSITMTSGPGATAITGNDYPSNPTTATYLDLSSTTNLIPGAVLATKVQRSNLFKSFSNVYSELSSNFRTSFKAQSANVMVEFRANVRADSRIFYGGLYDYNAGSYQADSRNRFNFNDESDQDFTILTWWIRNLTPGNTYYITPYFRGSSNPVYIYCGNSGTTDGFAPGIMRIIDGGNNVSVY